MDRPVMAKRSQDLECTSECRLRQHADFILACVAQNNLRLLQHCSSVCANYLRIADNVGRTPLLIAASMGYQRIVEWLVEKKMLSTDLRDLESGWTPLHRSLFYGRLGTAVYLVKNGTNMKLQDYDGLEPLSLLADQLMNLKKEQAVADVNLYTWGTNVNTTLGHDYTRMHPEKLDIPQQIITQVVLCKFHSVFLSKTGRVLSCGHGQGGRLGHGNEQSVLTPRVIEALVTHRCIQIAAARDHTVMLSESGIVYSCGLNEAHQLGHGSSPANCPSKFLSPKPIKVLKNIILVGVGRYHTAACSDTELYSFGKNLGQLGYEKTYGTQIAPRSVPGVSLDSGDSIVHLSVSDAGTACLTKKGRIFVCIEFTVKTIKCGFFERNECLQFTLRASLTDLETKRDREIFPPSVLMLDSKHKLWFWHPSRKGNTPSIVPGLAKLNAISFALGKSLTVVTAQGEAFSGPLHFDGVRLLKMSHVQNASSIFTDFKGNNFAYLQNVYRSPNLPSISSSTFTQDFCSILDGGHLHDITVSLTGQHEHSNFLVHKAILASCSPVLRVLLERHTTHTLPAGVKNFSDDKLVLDTQCLQAVQALLYFMYGAKVIISCNKNPSGLQPDMASAIKDKDDLTDFYDQYIGAVSDDSIEDPKVIGNISRQQCVSSVQLQANNNSEDTYEKLICCESTHIVLHELFVLANHFRIDTLKKRINDACGLKKTKLTPITISASHPAVSEDKLFADLVLVSSEGATLSCHRFVLVARSEYFRSMLLMGWKESSGAIRKLSLPINHHVLQAVVDYIYTDKVATSYLESIESISAVLVVADQLLMTHLKETCEFALANTITLKNVADMAQFALTYGANQLKNACLQFICINAACLLDGRYLDTLDSSLFEELSSTYLQMVDTVVKSRQIKFPQPAQSMIPMSYFMDDEEDILETNTNMQEDTCDRISSPCEDFTSPSIAACSVASGKKKRRRKSSLGDKIASSSVNVVTRCQEPASPSISSGWEKDMGTINSPEVSKSSIESKSQIDNDAERRNMHGKGAWGTTSPLSISGTSSLREIMAYEEMSAQASQAKLPNVIKLSATIPAAKHPSSSKSNLGLSASSEGSSPPFKSKPWSNNDFVRASTVSLKELMATEEKQCKAVAIEPALIPLKERIESRRQPSIIMHPSVSFASIIEAEKKAEMKRRKVSSKALHLIQIEEQAIHQIENLYYVHGNADEWITIQRYTASAL